MTEAAFSPDAPISLDAPWVSDVSPGTLAMTLLVPKIHCSGCIGTIERTLAAHPAVRLARVNFSTKRVRVEWEDQGTSSQELIDLLDNGGFAATPIMADQAGPDHEQAELSALIRALAVAGFAAGNIMLLSVSVWSGAEDATRDLFHWLSAMIAIPAVAYSGQPFFRSAAGALKARRLNMDVPISLAVLLALALSLFETLAGGGETYFDASVMLLFFLLVGRTLDRMMRTRARSAASGLLALKPDVATILVNSANRIVPTHALRPGMLVRVAAGDRIPADGSIVTGTTDIDNALLTGESLPETVRPGSKVHAGTMNMTAPLTMSVEAAGAQTLVSAIAETMEAAEQGKARYVRLADRAARIYAPAVHLAALATFVGWFVVTGGDWHGAALPAIAVLIITCPCALGLAVPAVQVVASGLFFSRGILLKDGSALERLAEIDRAVFDKTGTLTLGRPQMIGVENIDRESLAIAAGLASASNHPLSRAIVRISDQSNIIPAPVTGISETPGCGLAGMFDGSPVRLGSGAWCGADPAGNEPLGEQAGLNLWLSIGDGAPDCFQFTDELRPDAACTLQTLKDRGLPVEILSGDRAENVRQLAARTNVETWRAGLSPQEKLRHIETMAAAGHRVLVVGDGLNDGPALAAGHVSMAPASASDLGQTAADMVFLGNSLTPVADAHQIARKANRLVRQNFAFAALYNLVAVPLAAAGFVTPLIAAIAMSSSSLIVIANALRLPLMFGDGRDPQTKAAMTNGSQQEAPA